MTKPIKLITTCFLCLCFGLLASCSKRASSVQFHVTFSEDLSQEPIAGRLFVFLDEDLESNPVFNEHIFFAKDILAWHPGEAVVLDGSSMGFPYSLDHLPEGRYVVQAVFDKNDQEWGLLEARGNLYNEKKVLDVSTGSLALNLDKSVPKRTFEETDLLKEMRIQSELLSHFHGRPIFMEAAVVLPSGYISNSRKKYPVVYVFPGYDGQHYQLADGEWNQNRYAMNKIGLEKIFVFMDHDCPLGYHCFADSANNGPVGRAFVEEFIPFFENEYRVQRENSSRLLTGQSSGAWACLWLQVNYPELFGGAWSVSPDPVDFRNFLGVNLYESDTGVFYDQEGKLRPLIFIDGNVVMTWKDRVRQEQILGPGGWLGTFEGQFSPKGEGGKPVPLWNRKTGKLNPLTVKHWKQYDLHLFLKKHWNRLKTELSGKIFIFVADNDDARLDDSVRLLQASLKELGSDAFIKILATGGHGDGVWKQIIEEIHSQMDIIILDQKRSCKSFK